MRRVALALIVSAGSASADTPVQRPEAIDLDRDMTAPGRAEFGFDGGGPVGAYAFGLQLGFLDRPMRIHTVTRETYPVDHRETVWLGGAWSLGASGSVVLDARMPLSHQTGDRWQGWGDDRPLDRWVAGDLDLGARLRVYHGDTFGAFLRGNVTFGTGNDREFAGEARYTASWLLIGRAQLAHGIVVAATGGIRLRGAEVQVADRLVGDEVLGGVGATLALPSIRGLYCDANQVRLTGELVGALGDDVAKKRGPSPVEARIGIVSRPRDWFAVAFRVGTHLDDQIGAPRFRAMLELAFEGPAVVEPAPDARPVEDEEDSDD
jgi:hypothetical protein